MVVVVKMSGSYKLPLIHRIHFSSFCLQLLNCLVPQQMYTIPTSVSASQNHRHSHDEGAFAFTLEHFFPFLMISCISEASYLFFSPYASHKYALYRLKAILFLMVPDLFPLFTDDILHGNVYDYDDGITPACSVMVMCYSG